MKPKREMMPRLTLGQNYRLIMARESLKFDDIAKKAKVSSATAYRLVERTPVFITDQIIGFGKALGFTEKQIREKSRQDRLANQTTHSKKERFYKLVAEFIDLFDAKNSN